VSDTTRDINRVTGAIIKVSLRLIIYALIILIFYEGVTAGFEFGYEIFAATAVAPEPGRDKTVQIEEGQSGFQVGKLLEKEGLIHNRYAFGVQAKFYDYTIYPGSYLLNTSMTSREILDILGTEPAEEKKEPGT
jgi:cell division protein YceG involved in septum cleavage